MPTRKRLTKTKYSHQRNEAFTHSKQRGPWSRIRVGPSAYVFYRSISPAVMEKMPTNTKRFTDVTILDLVALRLNALFRSIIRPSQDNNPRPTDVA